MDQSWQEFISIVVYAYFIGAGVGALVLRDAILRPRSTRQMSPWPPITD